ncbi:hypothetical protein HBI56_120590 [Parastagonospora nodorum]|nr:hypothetical protein HBH51_120080 [Parastagonospora nodorum]KAH4053663.1 hypothetical protein HBH49_086770 [Parastagonospora nodorum]KAH4067211.1 hypothetical protein HBH50_137080 [Parastagonospora nodorum]KAH4085136.1 hypothetical protein HBH48_156870 [Parastagonospora nodorum]KAH4193051.1 hypothetical protein HBI95_203040 [Parastagonospora nodorum]
MASQASPSPAAPSLDRHSPGNVSGHPEDGVHRCLGQVLRHDHRMSLPHDVRASPQNFCAGVIKPEELNVNCGADHVKTDQQALPSSKSSLDGDADRVAYYSEDDQNLFRLLDGDCVATLVASFFGDSRKGKTTIPPLRLPQRGARVGVCLDIVHFFPDQIRSLILLRLSSWLMTRLESGYAWTLATSSFPVRPAAERAEISWFEWKITSPACPMVRYCSEACWTRDLHQHRKYREDLLRRLVERLGEILREIFYVHYHLLVRLSAMQLGSVILREIFYVFSERAYTLKTSSIAKGSDIVMVSEVRTTFESHVRHCSIAHYDSSYTSSLSVPTLSNTQEEDEEVVSPRQESKSPEDPDKYDHTAYFAGCGPRAYTLKISSIAKGSDIVMVSEGSNNLRVSG